MKEYNSVQLEEKEAKVLEDITKLTNDSVLAIPFLGDIDTAIKNFKFKSKESFWYENHHVIGFYFSRFDLKCLPENIGNLQYLRFIVIDGCCHIQTLPSTFKKLENLEQFLLFNYYEHNPIIHMDFPDVFKGLKKLKRFLIEGYYNIFFPPSFVELETLEEFHLEACLFSTIRERFLLNYNIKESEEEPFQPVYDLPDLGNIKSLRRLKLRSLAIEWLPPSIVNLTDLLEVDLSQSDKIKNIDIIFNINSLKKINLSRCLLKELPKTIGNLLNLEVLNLYNNNIKKVPFEITHCQKIKDLNLKSTIRKDTIQNWISCLIHLPQLKYLKINQAYVKFLSNELIEKKNLKIIAD